MNDADQQRLNEIRAKIRRIDGHKELSAKQFQTFCALFRELLALTGEDGSSIDEIFK
jgi:hypothetical protein